MTLIVGVLTNVKNYLIADKMHSLDGTKEEPKKADVSIHCFSLSPSDVQNGEMFSFLDWKIIINENSVGVLAIGSGGQLFLSMYQSIKKDCLERYREAISKNEYPKWETWFIEKIKLMYNDVSKYDDAVSNDIDIIEIQ